MINDCRNASSNTMIIKQYIYQKIKTWSSNLLRMTIFWNNLHPVRIRSQQKDWKINEFKLVKSKQTNGLKQDSQNWLMLLVSKKVRTFRP